MPTKWRFGLSKNGGYARMAGACNEYLLSHVEDVMRVTTAGMRKAVRGWLSEERASKTHTLQLLDALHAGAVDGGSYEGSRPLGSANELLDVVDDSTASRTADPVALDFDDAEDDVECGCLVDTLERIRSHRPTHALFGSTAEAFSLAVLIPLGATPANNTWAKAAARGIEDYYAAKGWR